MALFINCKSKNTTVWNELIDNTGIEINYECIIYSTSRYAASPS